MLESFKAEIHRLLKADPKLPGVRVRELLEPLGCTVCKTVVDDYLREVRPLFAPPPKTFQRTVYRPGEICQFDVWQPRAEVPVGHGQTRQGWVVVACLGYDRRLPDAPRGASERARLGSAGRHPRPRWAPERGVRGVLRSRSPGAFARADPQAKGAVERLQGYAEANFEPGRRFADDLDFQDQFDAWFVKINARTHKTLRARPADRLAEEHRVMAALPAQIPDCARRWVMRVSPDPYLRFDTNDYSLDPRLVGRRVEVCADQRHVRAVVLGTGEIACDHTRVFAKHRTITALEHARALREGRQPAQTRVEVRPLARYDALIA